MKAMSMTNEQLGSLLARLEVDLAKRPKKEVVEIRAADAMRLIRYMRDNGVRLYSRPVGAIKTRVVKRGGVSYREEV